MGLWPETVPFDPDNGAGSPVIDGLLRGPAAALTAVAVVVGARARSSGWGARAAVSLVRGWSAPRRPVLIDLDLERPQLHEHCGVDNDEGLTDIVEFGVSLRRVTAPVADGRFDFLPTGPVVGAPADVLRSDAWNRLLVEAARQGATLVSYVPVEADGLDDVVARAGAVLVLGEAGEGAAVVDRLPHPYAVLAILEPPAIAGEPVVPAEEPVVVAAAPESLRLSDAEFERIRLPTERGAREALIADLRARQRDARLRPPAPVPAAGMSGAPAESEAAAEWPVLVVPESGSETARDARLETAADDVRLDTIAPRHVHEAPRRRRFRHPPWWTIGIALLVALIIGAQKLLSGRLRSAGPAETPAATAAPEPVPAAVPQLTERELPYAVAVEAHAVLATALQRLDVLAAAQPDLGFHIAPLEREGTLYYHLMAGPVADSTAALALRDTLLARRVKTTATPTDVRHMPFALHIGDYTEVEDADRQISALREIDIPAYVVTGYAADMQPLYRLFVGGFAAAAEADPVRQLLRDAGIRDTLVTRTISSTE